MIKLSTDTIQERVLEFRRFSPLSMEIWADKLLDEQILAIADWLEAQPYVSTMSQGNLMEHLAKQLRDKVL